MRRKYQLIIIILISIIMAYFIYFYHQDPKLTITSIGDGIASGETTYNIDGISYSDYVKDYFANKHLLKKYYDNYAIKNYKLNELLDDLKSNIYDKESNLTIQQMLHKSDIVLINIGEEELVKKIITKDLTKEEIDEFLHDFDNLIYFIKDVSDAKIMIIGYYENKYLDKSNVIILNSEVSNIALKYEAIFINISDLMLNSEYYVNKNSFYFNYKGHKAIAEMIIHSI